MSKYPTEITEATLAKNAHISDEQIQKDIRDTEAEILSFTALQDGERIAAANLPDPGERRMADFRASVRPQQIEERREFVAFLTAILAARSAPPAPEGTDGK